jgi:uncharacterized Zn-binding protein involved in type VI secretion
MTEFVCEGATTTCSMGSSPAALGVTSQADVLGGGLPLATIEDFAPIVNIPTFGMCFSLANPEVAAATAAALGVLTPQPCVPNTTAPWAPGSPDVTLGGSPALLEDDTCTCEWTGVITIISPGQDVVSGTR